MTWEVSRQKFSFFVSLESILEMDTPNLKRAGSTEALGCESCRRSAAAANGLMLFADVAQAASKIAPREKNSQLADKDNGIKAAR
jgi:hypothetical protein